MSTVYHTGQAKHNRSASPVYIFCFEGYGRGCNPGPFDVYLWRCSKTKIRIDNGHRKPESRDRGTQIMDTIDQIKDYLQTGSLNSLVQAAATLIIGLIVIKIILKLTRRALNRSSVDSVLYTFIVNCVKIICLILLLMTVLSILGFPTSSFLTILAAASAAVALAVKDSLGNFVGGLLILVSKPFSKGDLIESNNMIGKVQEINLLYSRLVTFDNRIISVPNSALANSTLINHSAAGIRRVDLKVGVGYEADPDRVTGILRKALERSEYLLSEPKPVIGISDYGDSAVVYDAFGWCGAEDYFNARYDFYKQIKIELERENLDIPYSQIVVHTVEKPDPERRDVDGEEKDISVCDGEVTDAERKKSARTDGSDIGGTRGTV